MSSLISLMGITAGYGENVIPKIFFFAFSLLGFVKTFIFSLFKFMGFSYFLETRAYFQETTTRVSVSAGLIRELLPVIEFYKTAGDGGRKDQPESCAVCLCEFLNGEEIRWLRNCNHVFHRSCLDRWMDHDQWTCPLCRTLFLPQNLQE